ncbi:MAG TPA: acyltransferase domain-containing protein, partial [Acidimicrobiales bacterium]|nr:acyltransferase domain-containing protein [Acidimicrobiales bacterium]
MDDTVHAQAGLFALEVALFRLLASFGLAPEVVAGHSIGELTAAHVAGVFGLDDACRLVAARGRLMQALPAGGAMVALDATEAEALELIAGSVDQVAVAAVNGPSAVVVSGPESIVDQLAQRWTSAGRRARRLRVSHAFHSPLIEPMLDRFAAVAATIEYRPPRLALVSTITGRRVTDEVTAPGYWTDQARHTVRYADAVHTLHDQGIATLVEVGPDAQLATLVPDNLDVGTDLAAVATLRPGRDEAEILLAALARAWTRGAVVDWSPLFPGARRVDLPTYAFQHQRYWPSSAPAVAGPDPEATVAGWRYQVVWKPWPDAPAPAAPAPAPAAPPAPAATAAPAPAAPAPAPAAPVAAGRSAAAAATAATTSVAGMTSAATPGGRWLVVTSGGVDDAAQTWAERALADAGHEVVTLTVSPVVDRRTLRAHLTATAAAGPITGVVSLVGMDETPSTGPAADAGVVSLAGLDETPNPRPDPNPGPDPSPGPGADAGVVWLAGMDETSNSGPDLNPGADAGGVSLAGLDGNPGPSPGADAGVVSLAGMDETPNPGPDPSPGPDAGGVSLAGLDGNPGPDPSPGPGADAGVVWLAGMDE